jgi:hypothetical protein
MGFQTAIQFNQGAGIPGEYALDDRGARAEPGVLRSASAANNVFGRVFTMLATDPGVMRAGNPGGTGVRPMIMTSPKQNVSAGTAANGTLAPTLVLRNEEIAEFTSCHAGIWVTTDSAARPGDIVRYLLTTGQIHIVPPGTAADPLYADLPGAQVVRFPQPTVPGLCVVAISAP